jgi:hypothetical protein
MFESPAREKYVLKVRGATTAAEVLAVLRPQRPIGSGVVDDNELAWGVNGAGEKIEGGTVEAVPGRDRGI